MAKKSNDYKGKYTWAIKWNVKELPMEELSYTDK